MKKGEEMEMIIVVLTGSNQHSVGAAVTSEACPTVPGPHQSWGVELQQETVWFSRGQRRLQGVNLSPLHLKSTQQSATVSLLLALYF